MGAIANDVAEVTVDDIRDTTFDYPKLRRELAEYTRDEVQLQTRAIEDILRLGKPEFYETVEIEHEPWILIVIDEAAHLVTVRHDRCVETQSIGPLDGGVYTEVTEVEGADASLEGTFTHPRLPGAIRIRIARRRDRQFYEDLRVACRTWASRPAPC